MIPEHFQALAAVIAEQRLTIEQQHRQMLAEREAAQEQLAHAASVQLAAAREDIAKLQADLRTLARELLALDHDLPALVSHTPEQVEDLLR